MSNQRIPVPKIAEMKAAGGKKLEALIRTETARVATARNIVVNDKELNRVGHRYRGAFAGKAVGEVIHVKVTVVDDTTSELRKSDAAATIPHAAPTAHVHDSDSDERSPGSDRSPGSERSSGA